MESLSRTSRALARLSRADDIRLALDDLVTTLDEAESGERAYRMTGDRAFLQPYDRAPAKWRGDMASLRALTDRAQQADVAEIADLVERTVDAMSRTLSDSKDDASALAADFRSGTASIAAIPRVGNRVQGPTGPRPPESARGRAHAADDRRPPRSRAKSARAGHSRRADAL